MGKNNWSLFTSIPRNVPTGKTPDAKWGATSLGFSLVSFFLAVALAFWAIQISLDGGNIMLPSSVGAWVFFIFALLCFIFASAVGIFTWRTAWRWYVESGEVKDTSQELAELQAHIDSKINGLATSIDNLVNEIRQERNERNNKPK